MLCLFACTAVFPAAAQDAPAAPVPCSADEVKQVADLGLPFGDQLNTVSQKAYDKTLDGDTTSMLDWGDLYVSFFNDTYSKLPTCIDGVLYGNAVGLMLNGQLTIQAMLALNDQQNAAKNGDADVNQALLATFKLQDALAKAGVSSVNNLITQVKGGTATSDWVPACTADQAKFSTQLDELDQTYTTLLPALQTYLDTGTVDKTTYIASLKLVSDLDTLVKATPSICADDYDHMIGDMYTFGDTLTSLTLGQIAPPSDSASADRLTTLLGYCNDTLKNYVDGLAATATPEA